MALLADKIYDVEPFIHQQVDNGRAALHITSLLGNLTVVRLLLEAGANIITCDNGGDTPIDLAVEYGDSAQTALEHFNDGEADDVVALLQAYSMNGLKH